MEEGGTILALTEWAAPFLFLRLYNLQLRIPFEKFEDFANLLLIGTNSG